MGFCWDVRNFGPQGYATTADAVVAPPRAANGPRLWRCDNAYHVVPIRTPVWPFEYGWMPKPRSGDPTTAGVKRREPRRMSRNATRVCLSNFSKLVLKQIAGGIADRHSLMEVGYWHATKDHRALTTPVETVECKPSGSPMAMTSCPTRNVSELPNSVAGRSRAASRTRARSVDGSSPINSASKRSPSLVVAVSFSRP